MRGKHFAIFAVAALIYSPLMARQSSGSHAGGSTEPRPDNWQRAQREGGARQNLQAGLDSQYTYELLNRRRIKDLPKIRAHLAESWQRFGISPEAAKLVAAAYDYRQRNLADPPSIRGKTDEEVAAMMQTALAKKEYSRADHLLIEYERKRLRIPADTRDR